MTISSYFNLLKLRLGFSVEPEPSGRLITLYQPDKSIVAVPTVVCITNNYRIEDYDLAIRLGLSASDIELGRAVSEAIKHCRVDRSRNWWSEKREFIDSKLQALTECKRNKTFYKYVKYVQVSEEEGVVKFHSSVAGAIYTHTAEFEAPLDDILKLGKAACMALDASKFK